MGQAVAYFNRRHCRRRASVGRGLDCPSADRLLNTARQIAAIVGQSDSRRTQNANIGRGLLRTGHLS